MTLGLAAGVLLIAISLMQVRDRKVVARLGRRTAYLAIGPLLAFAVIPHLLDGWSNTGAVVAGTLLRSYSGRVLPSALMLAVVGCSVSLIALATRLSHISPAPAPGPALQAPVRATPPPPVTTPAAQPGTSEKLYL
jgi:hypothetical protein